MPEHGLADVLQLALFPFYVEAFDNVRVATASASFSGLTTSMGDPGDRTFTRDPVAYNSGIDMLTGSAH
jgi:hypothetical protein